MINYYSNGMLEYTFKKEVIAWMIPHNLPIRNLRQHKNAKYRYYVKVKNNGWIINYMFSGTNFNQHKHPRALDVRIAYSRA